MSNTQTIPARIDGKNNPLYRKEWKKKQDPIKKREQNRKGSQQYRDSHRQEWNEYFSGYFKQWYRKNKRIHFLRSKTANIKVGLLAGAKFGYENAMILANLKEIGWSEALDESKCLNHKISIKIFYDFNKDIPALVVFDKDNIEVILKTENNSASYREVTNDLVELASKLEKKYEILKGFTNFVNSMRGKIV